MGFHAHTPMSALAAGSLAKMPTHLVGSPIFLFFFLWTRNDARGSVSQETPDEDDEILGSDDDDQEDPRDYTKGDAPISSFLELSVQTEHESSILPSLSRVPPIHHPIHAPDPHTHSSCSSIRSCLPRIS